jgi:hypothetical protein
MKFIPCLSFFATFFLFGCGSDSGSSGSATSAVLQSASSPTQIPSGAIIAANPTLTLTTDLNNGGTVTATYSNTSSGSAYPASVAGGTVQVKMEVIGGKITLSFTADAKTIEWGMSQFLDRGGDGLTDEFTIDATIDGKAQASSIGQFVGGAKPTNENVSESERLTQDKISQAPTEAEFQKYLVGFAIGYTYDVSDRGLIYFLDSSRFINAEDGSGTYTYTKTGEKTALLVVNYDSLSITRNLTITFENFYKGKWEDPADGDDGNFDVWAGTDNLVDFFN